MEAKASGVSDGGRGGYVDLALMVLVTIGLQLCAGCADGKSDGAQPTTAPALPASGGQQSEPALERVAVPYRAPAGAKREWPVWAIAESPDGASIVWGNAGGQVWVYCWEDGSSKLLWDGRAVLVGLTERYRGHATLRDVLDVRFDAEGRLSWLDRTGYVFQAVKRKDGSYSVSRLRSPKKNEFHLAGRLLEGKVVFEESVEAGRSWWGTKHKQGLELVDLESGATTQSAPVFPATRGVNELIQCIALSPDRTLLMAVADGDAALVELPSLKIRKRFAQAWGESAAFSPDGTLVALGTDGRGLFVWSVKTGEFLWRCPFEPGDLLEPLIFLSKDVLYTNDNQGLTRVDLNSRGRILIHAWVRASALLVPRNHPDVIVCGLRSGSVEIYRLPSADRPSR